MPFIRRRGVTAAVAVIAAVMVTATACDSKTKDEGKASASSSAQGDQNDPGVDTGQDEGGNTLGGFKLPDGIPTDLTGQALQKWKDGGWKDFSDWKSKAEEFANPYIKDFWTPERVAEAKSAIPGVTEASSTSTSSGGGTTYMWTPDGKVKRKTATRVKTTYHRYAPPVGKIFFTTPQGSMVCSGAVVTDPAHPGKSNLVWTAGHCVHAGKGGGWFRNIAFVPSFDNTGRYNMQQAGQNIRSKSVSPYGIWWANWASTSQAWIKGGTHTGTVANTYDYALLHVKPEKGKKSLQESIGSALPVWFNAPAANKIKSMKVRGYPAESPYDGSKMYDCRGATKRSVLGYSYPSKYPAMYMIGCTLNGGASGGPWFMTHNKRTYLVSNSSLSDRRSWVSGPRLGTGAKQMYLAVSKKFKTSN
ncbi:trypsin-like serine peptidase [Streptomyces sp. NPDC001020]